jgi:selenocysteine-specific elongation factor
VLETLDDITVDGVRARATDSIDVLADSDLVARLEADPFSPPDLDNDDPAEIRELVRRGALVQEGGVVFAASAIDEAARDVARLLADQPDGITVAEARDGWGTTRKFAIPLITRLDETGVTRRRGDLRIAGPRLPQL